MRRQGSRLHERSTGRLSTFPHNNHKIVIVFTNKSPLKALYRITFLSLVVGLSVLGYVLPVNAALDSSKIAKGKHIFNQRCAFCHQADAIGKPGFAPSLSNKEFLSIASDKFLAGTIRAGRRGTSMPPFSYLGDDDINAVVDYLRSLSKLPSRVKEIEAQPKSIGNWQRGEKKFNRICLGCHGPKGNGYSAGGTGTAIGKNGFLSKVSDGFIRTTIKEGRSSTRMRSFQGPAGLADLTDSEIDDIIAYLRTIPSSN